MGPRNSYRSIQHETIDKGGVLLLRHDGIIREVRRARSCIDQGKPAALHLLKAQMGIVELDRTLNFEANPELADSLHNLYLHMLFTISEVLQSEDRSALQRIEGLLVELRTAWSQAAVEARQARRAG